MLLFVAAGVPARAQFVSGFGVTKTAYYAQTADSTPVLEAGTPFEFSVYVEDSGASVIDSAAVAVPGGLSPINLFPALFASKDFATQTAMNTTYKSGSYTFQVTDADLDVLSESLTLSGDAYPTIPQWLDFSTLQVINTNTDLTLHWAPFQGGTTSDRIYVDISFIFTDFTAELDGTADSVVIPAGTLHAAQTYGVVLEFNKLVDVNSNSGQGEAIYARSTSATIQTAGGGTVAVSIGGYSLLPNGTFQVQISGTPGATFTLEGTADFSGWTPVDTITPATGSGTLSDVNAASLKHRFYQIRAK